MSASKKIIFSHKYIVAPMVGQSDISFRLLCRKYKAQVTYSEMLYCDKFLDSESYRNQHLPYSPDDHPIVAQFCGNDKELLSQASRLAEKYCDAVDLNLGCPQQRALDGHYGSYLLDRKDWPTVFDIVRKLNTDVSLPIFCKIRLLPNLAETIEFCQGLEMAGCSMLSVHGRHRDSPRHRRCGPADLNAIKAVKESVTIPVISNGNVCSYDDIISNLMFTGADGIMSAEGVLSDPKLFDGGCSTRSEKLQVSLEYIDLCKKWDTPVEVARQHVNYFLGKKGQGSMVCYDYYGIYRRNSDLKKALDNSKCLDDLVPILHKSLGEKNCGGSSPLMSKPYLSG